MTILNVKHKGFLKKFTFYNKRSRDLQCIVSKHVIVIFQ